DGTARHQSHEVVLDGERSELTAEGGRRLASAGQTDDQHRVLLAIGCRLGGKGLQSGMERQPTPVVDETVPHPEAPHLGLTEVVRAEDPSGPVLEVDDDEPVVWFSRSRKTGGVY